MEAHYCKTHDTVWFKKGNMRSYAHPIKDGDLVTGWCNEPKEETTKVSEAPVPPKETVQASPDRLGNSIEQQVAFKGVIELMANKVVGKEEYIAQQALLWATTRLPPVVTKK